MTNNKLFIVLSLPGVLILASSCYKWRKTNQMTVEKEGREVLVWDYKLTPDGRDGKPETIIIPMFYVYFTKKRETTKPGFYTQSIFQNTNPTED